MQQDKHIQMEISMQNVYWRTITRWIPTCGGREKSSSGHMEKLDCDIVTTEGSDNSSRSLVQPRQPF